MACRKRWIKWLGLGLIAAGILVLLILMPGWFWGMLIGLALIGVGIVCLLKV